jgi:hypothetical protein
MKAPPHCYQEAPVALTIMFCLILPPAPLASLTRPPDAGDRAAAVLELVVAALASISLETILLKALLPHQLFPMILAVAIMKI